MIKELVRGFIYNGKWCTWRVLTNWDLAISKNGNARQNVWKIDLSSIYQNVFFIIQPTGPCNLKSTHLVIPKALLTTLLPNNKQNDENSPRNRVGVGRTSQNKV